jgi:hypothetical protein
MNVRSGVRALVAGLAVLILIAACSQGSPPPLATTSSEPSGPPPGIEGATPMVTGVEGRFNPTEAVGGGANSSSAVSDLARVMASVQQASQLKLSANASPPGATGADVTSVSIVAQDTLGVLKGLDAAGKKSLGDAILTAASEAWPNASVSLLVTDPAAGGGTVIGTRPKGGPNSVIAT